MATEEAMPESPMSEMTNITGLSIPEKAIWLDHSDGIATLSSLNTLLENFPLPQQHGLQWYNRLRYGFFSLYRRLFTLVVVANLATIAVMIARIAKSDGLVKTASFTYSDTATAVGANLTAAVVLRNEHVINFMFQAAVAIPHSVPLAIRKHAAKVYSYGGIHSSCGVASLLWYIFFTVLLVRDIQGDEIIVDVLVVTTALIITLLFILVCSAHPRIRASYHDLWENCHRYVGWLTVGIVWVQVFLLASIGAKQQDPVGWFPRYGAVLVKTPLFWFMIIITCCIIYPWIHLRKRSFEVEQLSSHALRLNFDYRQVRVGGAVRLSDSPLVHNHAFAVIPNPDGSKGYSVIISNAGDWTDKVINNSKRPSRLWMKGLPALGVVHIAQLFKPLVVVATGSGIGPCLSFLQMYPQWPVRIVWSARLPEQTYGTKIIDSILKTDESAIIIDTKKTGRPDLSGIVHAAYRQLCAEAILIISNQKVTEEVVYTLESRGVPAFGAIFDS